MKLVKLLLNAVVAWALGLAFIAATLYLTNDGADFTTTDLAGFGVLAIAASGLMMLHLYLPGLYWLKRGRGAANDTGGITDLTRGHPWLKHNRTYPGCWDLGHVQ